MTAWHLLLPLVGMAVATVGTLVGTGGGWAMVPLLVGGMGLSPASAVATSLSVVFFNAASGSAAYLRQGRLDFRMVAVFAACTVPGAVLGTWLIRLLDVRTFTLAFSGFLLFTGGFLLWGRDRVKARADQGRTTLTHRQLALGALVSVGVGAVSSVLGVGGGIIHVPFLVLVLGLAPHVATANSHAVLAVTSLVGVVTYASQGAVEWPLALPLGVGAVLGAQWGARLSTRISGSALQRVLGAGLTFFALVQAVRVW